MGIWESIKRWWNNLFSKKDIEEALRIKVITPPALLAKFDEWRGAMNGTMPHNEGDCAVPSQYTAANLVSRVAKLTMLEFKSEIAAKKSEDNTYSKITEAIDSTNPMIEYVNKQYQTFIHAKPKGLRSAIEAGLSGGRYLLYPSLRGADMKVAVLENNGYFPTRYNEVGDLAGVVIPLGLRKEDKFYTLLVGLDYNGFDQTYTMEHTAWVSEQENTIGKQIPLTDVQEWAELPEAITHYDVKRPWFIEYVAPNNGRAIFDKALDLFRKLDMQKSRTEWEFEGGELAVDVPADMWRDVGRKDAKNPRNGEVLLEVPKGKQRLYRTTNIASQDLQPTVFNPGFRNDSLEKGSNEIKRDIEDVCEVARGTISDVNMDAKTATEVQFTAQVTFTTIEDTQRANEVALRALVEVMVDMAWRYGLAPLGEYEVSFAWDDSIIADRQTEFSEKMQLVREGILSPIEMRAWYLGVDVESKEAQRLPGGFEEEEQQKNTSQAAN